MPLSCGVVSDTTIDNQNRAKYKDVLDMVFASQEPTIQGGKWEKYKDAK